MRAAHGDTIRAAVRRFIYAHLLPFYLDDRSCAVRDCKKSLPWDFKLFLCNAVNRLRAVDQQLWRADERMEPLWGKNGRVPFSRPQIKSVRISAAAMEEVIPHF